jgi:sortase A
MRDGRSDDMTMTRVLRGTGWLLIGLGVVVGLYVVYRLVFTGLVADAAQDALLEEWDLTIAEPARGVTVAQAGSAAKETRPAPPPPPGDGVAVLQFRRPGSDEPLVYDGPLAIVEGVGFEELKRGPGRYPGTAGPGEAGNFAIAGHRTTYGAPFFHLDRLAAGDVIDVTGRDGQRWQYTVREQRVVAPEATWTIGPDPLGTGTPMLTLTTCYPRFSDEQRLIVFAELTEGPAPAAA